MRKCRERRFLARRSKGLGDGNFKTGRYICETIEERRQLAAWIRAMGPLSRDVT